jgi:DNA (cytosine-5)-methyltransferase 1
MPSVIGLNRYRNHDDQLKNKMNRQLTVFIHIANYLRPKYVLMENVVDLMIFVGGSLGSYALSRLVAMSYQKVPGSYGLPQFRMRELFWGALPSVVCLSSVLRDKLPKEEFPQKNACILNCGST